MTILKALDRLKPNDFDDATELPHKLIWKISSEFFRKHKTLITPTHMAARMNDMVAEVPMLADPHIVEAVQQAITMCYSGYQECDLIPSTALEVLGCLLFERHTISNFDKVRSERAMTQDEFNTINDQRRADLITGAKIIEPFSDNASLSINIAPRKPIGIVFLDDLLNGGMRDGECMGFIAPSGGGKTTFSNQVAISYSMKRNHVFVFTYEEPVTDEYLQPVWACACKLPRSAFEKISSFSELPADQYAKYMAARSQISNYLHYIDMSGSGGSGSGFGGPDEIESILLEYRQRGIKANAFIIDWFWPMFKRWTSTTTKSYGESSGEERSKAQSCTDRIKQLCSKYDCWAWVNQQVAPAEAKKKRKLEQQDSAEFKSFSWYMNGCLALNTLNDQDNTGTLNYSKARSAKRNTKLIRLNGDMATFESCDPNDGYDPHQNKVMDKRLFNKVPRQRIPAQPIEPSALEKNYAG